MNYSKDTDGTAIKQYYIKIADLAIKHGIEKEVYRQADEIVKDIMSKLDIPNMFKLSFKEELDK